MKKLLQHIRDTGIDLPDDLTDSQLSTLCEVVIRACDEYTKENLWAEPGDLLDHFGIEE